MIFRHSFAVNAPLGAVADFSRRAEGLPAITPWPIKVHIVQAPLLLGQGDEMLFEVGAGTLQLRWLARIENASSTGFTDRQLLGPFACWVHRHIFEALDESTTVVFDEIEAILCRRPLPRLIGLLMWWSLPVVFAYRTRQTRRLLTRPAT